MGFSAVCQVKRCLNEVGRLESEPAVDPYFDKRSATLRWPTGVSKPKSPEGAEFVAVYALSAS